MKSDYFKPNFKEYTPPIYKTNMEAFDDWAPGKLMKVFTRYTQNSYFESINNALRSGFSESLLVNDDIESLDNLFKLVPNKLKNKTPITVYRGARITKELEDIINGTSSTDIFTEKAFVSTSRNKQVAKQFAMHNNKVVFEIIIPPNSTFIEDSMLPSHARSIMSSEEEVLLPRNAQFKITSFDKKGKIIRATYIGQKQPLEMPEVFKYSGSSELSKINKNLILNEKGKTNIGEIKKDFNQ